MRHTLLYIILAVIWGASLQAQIHVKWTPAIDVDLGTIYEQNGAATCTFVAKNTGDYSWQVMRGFTSCGCTQVDIEKERVVRPSDSTQVTVRFDPSGKAGPFKEVVTIQLTDGEDIVNEKLSLSGEVQRSDKSIRQQFPVEIDDVRASTSKIDFGELSRSKTGERHLSIYNASGETSKVTLSLPCPKLISLQLNGANEPPALRLTLAPGETKDIALLWHGEKETRWGNTHESLNIENVTTGKTVQIPLLAILLPDVSNMTSAELAKAPRLQTERRVTIGTPVNRTAITHRISISNTGASALQVFSAYSDIPQVEILSRLPLRIEAGKAGFIDVRIIPGEAKDFPITLISNDGRKPRQTIRLLTK